CVRDGFGRGLDYW
nr:immunoglobulin heavy chain junction region [Macaca mulatta]MOY18144.1 immunoglobulin heavy chain junction region [Macaca mulatta]MOY19031.1 immunoglobulin heavy chain junction region [Macaca mulatta]MOY19304.1 immunoglobulin heavy chain junction region [Macaca mulatta]MOY20068.1 immunoglobulin heavy chain junction region [Macaca mulatta]